MAEFGIVAAIGRVGLDRLIAVIADQGDARLPDEAQACLAVLSTQLEMVKEQILDSDRRILADARKTEAGRRLTDLRKFVAKPPE
jgi:transposase